MSKYRFNIGIRAHDLDGCPFSDANDIVKELKKNDIDYLQLVYKKAFPNFTMDYDYLKKVNDIFNANNVTVAMVGAYFNMVHPDTKKREDGTAYFIECMKSAHIFNAKYVGSETGSLNGDEWTYNPLNQTEETYNTLKETLSKIVKYEDELNVYPIVEGSYSHTINTPKLMKRLIDEMNIKNITFDLFNYLSIDNFMNYKDILDEGLSLFKDKIRIFHIKDFEVVNNELVQTSIGEGIMDYHYILNKIRENVPNAILILEDVRGDNIKKSVKYIRSFE